MLLSSFACNIRFRPRKNIEKKNAKREIMYDLTLLDSTYKCQLISASIAYTTKEIIRLWRPLKSYLLNLSQSLCLAYETITNEQKEKKCVC